MPVMRWRAIPSAAFAVAVFLSTLQPAIAAGGPPPAGSRKTLFSAPTASIEEFRAFAAEAKALGATHVYISDLPKSTWLWDLDRNDPYPNWGMLMSTVFKVVVPPELERFLPADSARRNLEIIRQRGAVLKELGLKAAFSGKEPAYLPETVFARRTRTGGAPLRASPPVAARLLCPVHRPPRGPGHVPPGRRRDLPSRARRALHVPDERFRERHLLERQPLPGTERAGLVPGAAVRRTRRRVPVRCPGRRPRRRARGRGLVQLRFGIHLPGRGGVGHPPPRAGPGHQRQGEGRRDPAPHRRQQLL